MKKILIVDDSAFMRGILKDLLTTHVDDVELVEAENKVSALKQLKSVHPDLVLLDIVMQQSELEGIEILTEIRHSYPNVNVIIITSVGQVAIIEECTKLGVENYIQKPFDQEEVIRNVKRCVG